MEGASMTIIKYLIFAFNLVVFVSQSAFILFWFSSSSSSSILISDSEAHKTRQTDKHTEQ